MRKTLLTVSALMAAAGTAGAQGANAIRLRLDPASELTVEGTSSMHDWHCKTNKLNAYVDVDPGYTKDLTKDRYAVCSVRHFARSAGGCSASTRSIAPMS